MINKGSFPQELTKLPQWVCWRLEPDKRSGRDAKIPYCPSTGKRASASNPATWSTFEEALFYKDKYNFSGIGFMFSAESGIIGIDIDHCFENNQPNEIAADILAKLPPTYIEISPSGTGLHIFLKGTLPPGGNRNSKTGVEMYSNSRYFTMTGSRYLSCVNSIAEDNGTLAWIHKTYIKARNPKGKSSFNPGFSSLTDDKLLEMAQNSKDGAMFNQLWRGDWQGRYPSQSEADFALCCKLAFWSNRDKSQIDRLFRQSGLIRDKWDIRHSAGGATYGENTVSHACMATTETYMPLKPKNVSIFEQNGCYYRKKGENLYQLTNFLVRPIEIIKAEDETQITCDFISASGEAYRQALLGEDFCNLQRFKKILNKRTISLSFFGTEGDLEAFKDFISSFDWKIKKGVKALGIFKQNGQLVFVTPEKAVAAGNIPVDSIMQVEKWKQIESSILKAKLLTSKEFLILSELLLGYNEPAKTVPVLAWVTGCFIKPHLRRYEVMYPHLFLIGEQGSGKSTTLERIIAPIFGNKSLPSASQVTAFTLMRDSASSNVIPQFIEEHKPSTLDKYHIAWLCNHFRDVYDNHKGQRGRTDQSIITYDLLAPLAVAGEESPNEAAIRERSIELLFSQKTFVNQEYIDNFHKLRECSELLVSFGRSILDMALQTDVKEAAEWYKAGYKLFDDYLPSRVHSNLAAVYAGLKLTEKYCFSFDHSWDYFFSLPLEACAGQLSYAVKEYLLDGGMHNKSIVEQTFEVMSRMNLKCDVDYTFEASGKHLCIWFAHVYDRYTKYKKDYAVVGECLPVGQFYKQLEHSVYFIAKNKPKRMGDTVRKVWVVDFERLSQMADVSGFLASKIEDDM